MEKSKYIKSILFAALLALMLTLAGCGQEPAYQHDLDLRGKGLEGVEQSAIEHAVYIDLRDSGITDLSFIPDNGSVMGLDVRGNDIKPEEIEKYSDRIDIFWSVPFSGEVYDNDTQKITIDAESFDPDTLDNLRYFRKLKICDLSAVKDLDSEKIGELQELMPGTTFIWYVSLGKSSVLSTVTELSLDSRGYTDLTGLKYCKSLKGVTMRPSCSGIDISPLKDVPSLEKLEILYAQPESYEPLKEMKSLKRLQIVDGEFEDLTPVSGLTQLEELYIEQTLKRSDRFDSLDPIKNLTNLTTLDMTGMGVKDVSAISGMIKLQSLYLLNNPIEDMSAAANLHELASLDITNTLVTDISFLSGTPKLKRLSLGEAYEKLANSGYGFPSVGKSVIEDYSPISKLTELTNLIIVYTQIDDLSFIEPLENLRDLDIAGDKIGDLTPMTKLPKLTYVTACDCGINAAKQKELKEAMPDTQFMFSWDELF